MRYLFWIALLLLIHLGCSKPGNRVIDLSDPAPALKTKAEIDAEMRGH